MLEQQKKEIMANLFNQDFLEYVQLLNKHEVEYILVGGMAVNLHGYRRTTGDMDLFVNPTKENHLKIRRVHHEFGMFLGEMETLSNFLNTGKYDVYTFGMSPIQIDVMTACKGISFDEAFEAAKSFEIEPGTSVTVVHFNDLIIAKKASNRPRDIADIHELEKVKKNRDKGMSMDLQ